VSDEARAGDPSGSPGTRLSAGARRTARSVASSGRWEQTSGHRRCVAALQGLRIERGGAGHANVPRGRLTLQNPPHLPRDSVRKPGPVVDRAGTGEMGKDALGPLRSSTSRGSNEMTWADGFDPRSSCSKEHERFAGRRRRTLRGDPPGARAATERQRYARRRAQGRERPGLLASPPKPADGVNRSVAG
jgi:hypothetical protein